MNITPLLMENMAYVWMALAVLFVVVEMSSVQLVSIWLALGAVVSIIPALLHLDLGIQFTVFIVVSALSIYFTRPFVKKVLTVKKESTNADRVIGECGIVIEEIDNIKQTGRVHVMGLDWTARSYSSEIIAKDSTVTIRSIEGVKVIVEKVLEPVCSGRNP